MRQHIKYERLLQGIQKYKSTKEYYSSSAVLGKLSEVSSTAFNQTEDPVVTWPLGEVGRKSAT